MTDGRDDLWDLILDVQTVLDESSDIEVGQSTSVDVILVVSHGPFDWVLLSLLMRLLPGEDVEVNTHDA